MIKDRLIINPEHDKVQIFGNGSNTSKLHNEIKIGLNSGTT
jgi:hypothetical protein